MTMGDNNNNINVNISNDNSNHGMTVGKVALIMSIIGAVCASCCCTTYFSFIFFGIAIVCGIVAIVKNKHDGAAIASLIISGVFVLIAILLIVTGIGSEVVDSVKNGSQTINP